MAQEESANLDSVTTRDPERGGRDSHDPRTETLHLELNDGQRRFARIHPHVIIALDNESDIRGFAESFIGDISLGGMFVNTSQPSPIGTTVRFRLPARGDIPALEMSGEVVRVVSPYEVTDEDPDPGMAILFNPDELKAAEWLRELIAYYAFEENSDDAKRLAGSA